MFKTIITIPICLLCCAGCNSKTPDPIWDIVTIDLDSAMRGPERELQVSDFADSITYIPIYDGNPAYIGDPIKMTLTDNHLLVYDMNRRLVSYDLRNRTSRYIGTRGRGPREYLEIFSIAADQAREVIYALVGGVYDSEIFKYDFEGNFLSGFPLPENADNIFLTAEGNLVAHFTNRHGVGTSQYGVMDGDGNTLAAWPQPFAYRSAGRNSYHYESAIYSFGGRMHIKDHSDTLWVFRGTERQPRYVFSSKFSIDGRRYITQADYDNAFTPLYMFETDAGLVFNGQLGGTMYVDRHRFYYDKTTGVTHRINPDIPNDLDGYPKYFRQITADTTFGDCYVTITSGAFLVSQGHPDVDENISWYLMLYHLK